MKLKQKQQNKTFKAPTQEKKKLPQNYEGLAINRSNVENQLIIHLHPFERGKGTNNESKTKSQFSTLKKKTRDLGNLMKNF